jgi:hypothetical protein
VLPLWSALSEKLHLCFADVAVCNASRPLFCRPLQLNARVDSFLGSGIDYLRRIDVAFPADSLASRFPSSSLATRVLLHRGLAPLVD